MIKKLIFMFAAAVCAVACLDDEPNYSIKYRLDTTFEYGKAFSSTSDSLYFENQIGSGLGWQDMGFYHKLNAEKTKYLGGFILSRLNGGGDSEDNRFRVCSGAGMDNSYNYVVYYDNGNKSEMPEKDVEFISAGYGTCTMTGCFINNTKEVVDSVRSSFVDGDRLAVRMTGYLAGVKTGAQEHVLAEYTENKDSLVISWAPFDLGKLGQVDVIDIEIISTRSNIPKAFCMDDMIASISLSY